MSTQIINNKIYLYTGLSIALLGLILSLIYRPFVYNNNINDLGFADTLGSLVSVISYCNFTWGLKEYSNNDKNKQILIAILIFGFFWEFLGFIHVYGTFDIKDIIAVLISGFFTYVLKELMNKVKRTN